MIDLTRLGDMTDHGGEVVRESDIMRYDGRRVARKGDLVTCPLHSDINPNVFLEGDGNFADAGVSDVRHGQQATCDCHLKSSLA